MSMSSARIYIYSIWGIALLLYVFMFELAPSIRPKGLISTSQAHPGMLKVLALVSPVLGVFARYWFGPEGADLNGTISKERWFGALSLTAAYHLILAVLIFNALYLEEYTGSVNGIGHEGGSFDETVAHIMQVGVTLSAIVTAPAAFLVGSEQRDSDPKKGSAP